MKEQVEIQERQHYPVVVVEDSHALTTSLNVAEYFEKAHKNVLQSIENLDIPEEFSRLNFQPISYVDSMKREQKMYRMTKSGFALLAMGFTGPKAMRFKVAYINQFDAMEAWIKEPKYREQIAAQTKTIAALEENRELLAFKNAHTRWSRKRTTEAQKRTVIELKLQGARTNEIKRQTGLSVETVCRIIRIARKEGVIPPAPVAERLEIMRLHPELIPEVL